MTTATPRTTGRKRLAVAVGAVLLLASGTALTSAAFTDQATANLGAGATDSGIGNPHRFDIAVRDADGQLKDADSAQTAVVLPLASGTAFSEDTPVRLVVAVTNRDPGVAGHLKISVYDPDPATDDLYGSLRFTISLDGNSTPVVTDKTADEVNAAGIAFPNVEPGAEHQIVIDMRLAPGTSLSNQGKSTSIGLKANGESV